MRKAVIVDFDGTLVGVNSFEEFYRQLFRYWLTGTGIMQAMYLVGLALIRKTRLIRHAELKRRFLLYVKDRDMDQFLERFAMFLRTKVNTKVVEIIQDYRGKGYAVLLCTAAPRLYMDRLASFFGFDDMVCTEMPAKNTEWQENSGIHKLETTRELLRERQEELAVLLTDSFEDMPLLCIKKEKNYFVTRSVHTARRLKDAGIDCEVI